MVLFEKYSDDEPRDERGRWTNGGTRFDTGLKLRSTTKRAFNGSPFETETKLSKLEVGTLGERIAIAYFQQQEGRADARPADQGHNNYAVDIYNDHQGVEVKAGQVSNGTTAQHWRVTIGEPSAKDKAWLKKATPEQKKAHNQAIAKLALQRKQAALTKLATSLGKPVKGFTLTSIINPDTRTADVYKFKGFHLYLRWNSEQAKAGYVGSFKY